MGKLVRDKIPEIIEANGEKPITRVLDDEEYQAELDAKLQEEVGEFLGNPSLEEMADIQEVIRARLETMGHTPEDLEAARLAKHAQRGGFAARIYLEGTEQP